MSELLPCPFCGCAMSVLSNSIRGEYRPKGDHDNNCAFYGNDLIFPETDHGMRALLSVWNSRAPAQQPAATPVSGDVALPELPDPTIEGSAYHPQHKICYMALIHFTAEQMRTYGQQCSDAALERAAKAIDEFADKHLTGDDLKCALALIDVVRALKGGE